MIHENKELINHPFANEVINACLEMELERAGMYQEMVLRYLPFSMSISLLMTELSRESEARVERLVEFGKTMESQGGKLDIPWRKMPSRLHKKGHFFIIDALMAVNVLDETWRIEGENRGFYKWLKARSATPCLDRLFTKFIEQTNSQMRILQEARSEALLLGRWRQNSGMMKKVQ